MPIVNETQAAANAAPKPAAAGAAAATAVITATIALSLAGATVAANIAATVVVRAAAQQCFVDMGQLDNHGLLSRGQLHLLTNIVGVDPCWSHKSSPSPRCESPPTLACVALPLRPRHFGAAASPSLALPSRHVSRVAPLLTPRCRPLRRSSCDRRPFAC